MLTPGNGEHSPLALKPLDFRAELVRCAHWVADYLEGLPDEPVIRLRDPAHRRWLALSPLRPEGQPVSEFLDFVDREVAPYPCGNGHPAFFGWLTSPPAPIGIIADLIGSALNANCGVGEHALLDMERGAVRALAELAGLPASTSGVLTGGGSMSNLLCVAAARTWYLNRIGATDGPAYDEAHSRLVCYQSAEAHLSIAKAVRTMGLPASRMRTVPVTADLRLDVDALRRTVRADHEVGFRPFCVISNLGTVGTGVVDPLPEVTRICQEYGMWHHADGAYGGLGAAHPDFTEHYQGIADLDSLAVDPHKILNVPIDCGAALVTNLTSLQDAFAMKASYLDGNEEWPWMSEYTLELTRSAGRTLKVWAVLHQLGRQGVIELLEHYQRHTRLLRALIAEHPDLELITDGPWAITCFRYAPAAWPGNLDALNTDIAHRLQARGRAFLATVRVHEIVTLRASVCNYRTTKADVETLVSEVLSIGRHLTSGK